MEINQEWIAQQRAVSDAANERLYSEASENAKSTIICSAFDAALDALEAAYAEIARLNADLAEREGQLTGLCKAGQDPCIACRHGGFRGDVYPCDIGDTWCGGVKWELRITNTPRCADDVVQEVMAKRTAIQSREEMLLSEVQVAHQREDEMAAEVAHLAATLATVTRERDAAVIDQIQSVSSILGKHTAPQDLHESLELRHQRSGNGYAYVGLNMR